LLASGAVFPHGSFPPAQNVRTYVFFPSSSCRPSREDPPFRQGRISFCEYPPPPFHAARQQLEIPWIPSSAQWRFNSSSSVFPPGNHVVFLVPTPADARLSEPGGNFFLEKVSFFPFFFVVLVSPRGTTPRPPPVFFRVFRGFFAVVSVTALNFAPPPP